MKIAFKKVNGLAKKALIFGSIGTLLETSELQRQAFNRAFAQAGLDWYWNVATYCRLLAVVGGKNRIRHHAMTPLPEQTIEMIHETKERHFSDLLEGGAAARPGVVELIRAAQARDIKVGWATTTSQANVDAVFSALVGQLTPKDFDVVLTAADVTRPKPDPEVYLTALSALGVEPGAALGIEDTAQNHKAACEAGMACIFFPGEYAEAAASTGPRYALTPELLD